MLGLGRGAIVMLVAMTLIYLCLFFYLRSGARMRLEEDWIGKGRPGDRDAWVEERLGPAVSRIRMWLTICVYVIPFVALTAFIWLTN